MKGNSIPPGSDFAKVRSGRRVAGLYDFFTGLPNIWTVGIGFGVVFKVYNQVFILTGIILGVL